MEARVYIYIPPWSLSRPRGVLKELLSVLIRPFHFHLVGIFPPCPGSMLQKQCNLESQMQCIRKYIDFSDKRPGWSPLWVLVSSFIKGASRCHLSHGVAERIKWGPHWELESQHSVDNYCYSLWSLCPATFTLSKCTHRSPKNLYLHKTTAQAQGHTFLIRNVGPCCPLRVRAQVWVWTWPWAVGSRLLWRLKEVMHKKCYSWILA